MNLAIISAPVLGGLLFHLYGYKVTAHVGIVFLAFVALSNIIFNCGFTPFADRARELKNLEDLKYTPKKSSDDRLRESKSTNSIS